jgi:hypothetical protein
MDKLGNLLKQQELLQAQIADVKTADVREEIDRLKAKERELVQKIADAKAVTKITDADISQKIAEHKAEIKKLNDMSISRIYFRSQLENELRSVQGELTKKQFELKSLLSEI